MRAAMPRYADGKQLASVYLMAEHPHKSAILFCFSHKLKYLLFHANGLHEDDMHEDAGNAQDKGRHLLQDRVSHFR